MHTQLNERHVEHLVFMFSLKETLAFLESVTKDFDPDPEFAYSILTLMVASIMQPDHSRGEHNTSFQDAMNALMTTELSQDRAYQVCLSAGELIIQAVCGVVPDFNDEKYRGKYSYQTRNHYDVQLTIHRSAWDTNPGWAKGVSCEGYPL